MKITDHERRRLLKQKARERPPRQEESELDSRCREAGKNPGTIRNRMRKYGIGLEEALRMKPMERQAIGKTGKQRSEWRHLGATEGGLRNDDNRGV
ncbi:hypothetical protein [Halomonas sp. NO4]|uniref:hypothetical protein n=1 Tax=Halomonas sp. NO4 TaxID=2484813 RepID=UPI0013D4FD00|nr:hypothetical protein [Halomonas sp. NO4]